MRLVLLRHGEKSWLSEGGENPLSERGSRQALHLVELVQQGQIPRPSQIWVSPLIRTKATIAPLAEAWSIPVLVKRELLLHQENETYGDFSRRVKELINSCYQDAEDFVLLICSHQDWLMEVMSYLPLAHATIPFQSWASGQFMVFNRSPGSDRWELIGQGRLSWTT
ncbi:MAG: histidine phosphatase family protein [Bdellovibrionaceae bacterium]|nr:histidine phosphatase family protein [Pseudobdellovibrionaceae bacterium]MDW8190629.1 phosphoglycerate mutase family protein [Pseudobdellovibrionaceae bacterium]